MNCRPGLDRRAGAGLEYGISRTPLREALKVLAAEGLVVLKPRRGCYVTELSEQDIDEVFPVMAMLEGRVAELAARRATSADFSRLAAIHRELEEHAAPTMPTASSRPTSASTPPCRKSPATATWRN
jgi:DNA-binding GntR family transcriptional regulator